MSHSMKFGLNFLGALLLAVALPQSAAAQMTLTGSVSPKPVSYIGTVTYSASASGGDPATTQYAFFRRRPGGTWIPSVYSPNWQSSGTFYWSPTLSDVGTWETYIWAKDAYTPASASNGYGYAAGYNTMPIDVVGPPTVPGPTSAFCAYSESGVCWVTGDFVISVNPSTGGMGSLIYHICRSNDTTGWGGCDVHLTMNGGTSITVSGSHLPSDGYRRVYYFQSRDSAGAYSGWNTPLYAKIDRYDPSVSASNASSLWYSSRTATISASDGQSGLQSVRYSWNSPHNGSCTSGTSTSVGATLTAPAGDNILYVCGRDNTGRVGQWSGSYRVSPIGLTGSISPSRDSYLRSFTYTANATGGTPSTMRYAFFRRRPGGTWIPDVYNPTWQTSNVYTWQPTLADEGTWETYIWVKDGDTPASASNGYGYAAGYNTMPIEVVGKPTVPGPTTVACAYSFNDECWVQGDFTASVTASTGGMGTLNYHICRSNDTTGWGGCDVHLTFTGGTSILVSGTHLPPDGYRRAYYFQTQDSAGAFSGWNTPRYVKVDRYAPTVSASNASDEWFYSRTAVVSASDTGSGVQSVRYSWGSALDASCTTGTATSIGASLTAPPGDNLLYLCAKDNTGRVAQWNGRYRIAQPLALTGSISPSRDSYLRSFTYTANATGGIPSSTQYAFFRRIPGGTWIPSVSAPNWQSSNQFTWQPTLADVGTWETYIWVKDSSTPASASNGYGYAAGYNTMPIEVVGKPTVPGATTVACAYTTVDDCWVQGDFTATVTASTGGMGTLNYHICRSNDVTGWGGCDVHLTFTGGPSILVSGTHLPSDGYRRAYYFQTQDSAGAYSGWNTPRFVRVDRYPPTVSATNASDLWFSSRTATIAASDAGSGLQGVRYGWNTALDANCTTGTATSNGATLTAPAGDNLLYLCAKDNTGRIAQWNGRYRVAALGLTGGSVSPTRGSYLNPFTFTVTASGGTPATTLYAFFRRRVGGTWIPDVTTPTWQTSNVQTWQPVLADVGMWEAYVWVKDGDTPANMNTYGYAAGVSLGQFEVVGKPTVPGPTTIACAYTTTDDCWVQGDFTATVTASTGGMGTLNYHICRSNDTTGWGGCEVHLTFTGGSSILVSGTHLPGDGYRRGYYFQTQDSAGAYSGWNTPRFVRVDRYAPTVSATNASDLWFSSRTAVLSASDTGSGLQGVRYSWNTALDANCSTGTATSNGATLTAPSGDNLLYLCATDNTGRIAQWNGRYRVAALGLTGGSVSPTRGSYLNPFTFTVTASGGTPATIRYAFFRRRVGGTWIPDVTTPTWQTSNVQTWQPVLADVGMWEAYVWVKDGDTPANMNTYGYAAGVSLGQFEVVGKPTIPGPTTIACAYTAADDCWVQGDFTATVTASTGGMGTLNYHICRSNDVTGWGGCEVHLTFTGGPSILVSGTHLPTDGYRRAYYFQTQDSAGAYSGWNSPRFVRVDRNAPTVSADNASEEWFTSRTATVSASDADSGLQAVRISWNNTLDAGCTTGTAASSGNVLTVPEGDNELYLCAKDNVGRVTQWSGQYRVQSAPEPVVTSVSPKVVRQGTVTVLTVTGTNLQDATVYIATEPYEERGVMSEDGAVSLDAFPTAELIQVNEAGTSLTVRIDATEAGVEGFHNLVVATPGGQTAGQFRVVGAKPVVDVYTPSQPVRGNIHVLTLLGANLENAQIVPLDPAVKVLDLDNSDDHAVMGLLYVSSDAPVGAYDIRVERPGGEYQTLSINVVGSAAESSVAMSEFDVPGRSLGPDVPNVYLQEPVRVSSDEEPGQMRKIDASLGVPVPASFCWSVEAWDAWDRSAILLTLSNDLGEPLTREALNLLAPGTRINFSSLTIAVYAWIGYKFTYRQCSDGSVSLLTFCVQGGIYSMVPYVGGEGYEFDLCYGNGSGSFKLTANGYITRHVWSSSGSCLDVEDDDPESPSGDRAGKIVVHCCDPTDVSLRTSGRVWNSEFDVGGKVIERRPQSCTDDNACGKKIEWQYVNADNSVGPPQTGPVDLVTTPDQRKAKVTVEFTPEGGTFQGTAWSGGGTLVTLSGETTDGTKAQVILTAEENPGPGSETVTTPLYQWMEQLECTANVAVRVSTVEVEVNGTPAKNDDMVQQRATVTPDYFPKTKARVRLPAPAPNDVPVVINNPDGRLRFGDSAEVTQNLTLPKSGDWVEFEIVGEIGSEVKDDAVIEVHQDTAEGAVLGRQTATVFYFDSQLQLTRGGDYVLGIINNLYALAADPAPGVSFAADATLKPSGLDCSAPPLKNLRIGFMQQGLGERTVFVDRPSLVCLPGNQGKKPRVPAIQVQAFNHQDFVPDSADPSDVPLYSREPQALVIPRGCTGGETARAVDMPTSSAFPTADLSIPEGTVTYRFKKLVMNDAFRIWSVSFDTQTGIVVPLKESEWYLQADSDVTGPQGVTALPSDRAPTRSPLTSGRLFNDPLSFTKRGFTQGGTVELVCPP